MRGRLVTLALALAVLFLASCSASEPVPTGAPGPTARAGGPSTAADVLTALRARVPHIADAIVYDASTDPNGLLGRPGQYTSKAGFHDARVPPADVEAEEPFAVRRGGDIEVFEDERTAQVRADYINAIVNQPGGIFGPEYIFRAGRVLLRVSRSLTPDQAAEYEAALVAAL